MCPSLAPMILMRMLASRVFLSGQLPYKPQEGCRKPLYNSHQAAREGARV